MDKLTLRAATAADFPFIRALAQRPDYAHFITDQDDAVLAGYLADPSCRLLIAEGQDGPAGFALFCEIGDPSGAVELRRLALAVAGQGRGAGFIAELVDYAFRDLSAARLWLDASGENLRAMTLYERAGFTREGVLRRHWYRPMLGRVVDMHLFGMLREEWAALRGGA